MARMFGLIVTGAAVSVCREIYTSEWRCIEMPEFPIVGCQLSRLAHWMVIAVVASIGASAAPLVFRSTKTAV
jgi:hypothetical protein